MDMNNDGKVSMDELMEFSDDMRRQIASKDLVTIMEEMDGNRDGKLSSWSFQTTCV